MSAVPSSLSLPDSSSLIRAQQLDSDGESAASSAKSAMSSTASSVSSHEVTFHSQLQDVVNLFAGWHDCEQSIALLVLLRKTSLVQWRYLYHQIETRLSTATDLSHKEECANNPVFLRSLDSRSDEDLVSALLTHLPLLRPGNEEAKSVLLNLLEKAFKSNVDGGLRLLECRRILTFALLHPAMNLEDRRNLQTWLPRIEERITSDVKLAHEKMLAHNDILNSAIDISSPNTFSNPGMIKAGQRNSWDLPLPSAGNGTGGYNLVNGLSGQNQDIQALMAQAISLVTQKPGGVNGSAGANYDLMSSMSASTRSFPGGNNNPHMSQFFKPRGPQRNNLSTLQTTDKSRLPNANQKPINQYPPNNFNRQLPSKGSSIYGERNGGGRAASLAFPDLTQLHASLPKCKASSLNNGSAPSLNHSAYSMDWPRSTISLDKERPHPTTGSTSSNGSGNCISFLPACYQNQNPPGSRQSSYGQNNHAGSSVDQYTNQGTFAIPGSGMREVPSWLKSLRLHKYCSLFSKLTYEDMFELTEEKLEAENVTKGARHKIVLNLQKLKQRQSVLQALEKDLISEPSIANLRSALTELKNMLGTPMKAFTPPSHSTSCGSQDPFGDIEGCGTAKEVKDGDLPEQFTQLCEKVYKSFTEKRYIDYDSFNTFNMIAERCLNHDAFNESQKNRISEWRNKLQNMAEPPFRRNSEPRPGSRGRINQNSLQISHHVEHDINLNRIGNGNGNGNVTRSNEARNLYSSQNYSHNGNGNGNGTILDNTNGNGNHFGSQQLKQSFSTNLNLTSYFAQTDAFNHRSLDRETEALCHGVIKQALGDSGIL